MLLGGRHAHVHGWNLFLAERHNNNNNKQQHLHFSSCWIATVVWQPPPPLPNPVLCFKGPTRDPQTFFLWVDPRLSSFILDFFFKKPFASVFIFYTLWLESLLQVPFFFFRNWIRWDKTYIAIAKAPFVRYLSFVISWYIFTYIFRLLNTKQSDVTLLRTPLFQWALFFSFPLSCGAFCEVFLWSSQLLCVNQWSHCNAMSVLFLFSLLFVFYNHRVLW